MSKITYEANSITRPDIFLIKSTDGGNNFSKPIDISNSTQNPWEEQREFTILIGIIITKDGNMNFYLMQPNS
jgi:hypothetical protein